MAGRFQGQYLPRYGADFEADYARTNDLDLAYSQAVGYAADGEKGVDWRVYDYATHTAHDVTPRGWKFGRPEL